MSNKRKRRALYLAYGANTCIESMRRRCPHAEPVSAIELPAHRLVFRAVADITGTKHDAPLHGALWRITDDCERALDLFEGYPSFYIKRYFSLPVDGRIREVMAYIMRERNGQSPPGQSYEDTLRRGYDDFGLPQSQIDDALRRAHQFYVSRPLVWRGPKRARQSDFFASDDDNDGEAIYV